VWLVFAFLVVLIVPIVALRLIFAFLVVLIIPIVALGLIFAFLRLYFGQYLAYLKSCYKIGLT
jgi:hypothetical protein